MQCEDCNRSSVPCLGGVASNLKRLLDGTHLAHQRRVVGQFTPIERLSQLLHSFTELATSNSSGCSMPDQRMRMQVCFVRLHMGGPAQGIWDGVASQ